MQQTVSNFRQGLTDTLEPRCFEEEAEDRVSLEEDEGPWGFDDAAGAEIGLETDDAFPKRDDGPDSGYMALTPEAREHLTDPLLEGIKWTESIARRIFDIPETVLVWIDYELDPEIPDWAAFVLHIPTRDDPSEAAKKLHQFYTEALWQVDSETFDMLGIDFDFEQGT